MKNETRQLKKKICLIGAFGVGKTSLIERYVYNRFDDSYLTTIGVKVSQKRLPPFKLPNAEQLVQHTFLIWDIAGLEKFNAMVQNYYAGAAGALAVADLTRPDSADDLKEICDKFSSVNPEARIIILGNKTDLVSDETETESILRELSAKFSTQLMLTSAKSGENVENSFIRLAEILEVR